MCLSGWNKDNVLKLSIDHTNISNSLADFPVLINLTDSSGKNNYDCSDVFDKLNFITNVDDDFTGEDGDLPNTILWDETRFDLGRIKNNKFYVNDSRNDGTNKYNSLYTNYVLTGDFDIQIDVEVINFSGDNAVDIELTSTKDNYHIYFLRRLGNGGNNDLYCSEYNYDWSGASNSTWSISPNEFKFRLKRSGTSLTAYIWYNNQWQWNGDTNGHTYLHAVTEDIHIPFYVRRNGSTNSGNVEVYLDNFKVNSGTVVWPVNEMPNRKKIAVVYPSVQEHWVIEGSDNFTANDNDPPNSSMWTLTEDSNLDTNSIQNNNYVIKGTNTQAEGKITSKFKLQNDFDIETRISYCDLNTDIVTADIRIYFNNNDHLQLQRAYNSAVTEGPNYVSATEYINGSWQTSTNATSTVTDLKLRVTRSNTTVKYYYDTGSGWTLLRTATSITTSDCYIELGCWQRFNNASFEARFDYFYVNTGTIDYGLNPTYRELKTYIHGDQEQLYCEIERWDQDNKSTQLWVKVPRVLADQPTDLFLYYDKTQEDNTGYVGDTGDWAAQKVWDDNYIFVYHLSQDPSAGTDSIHDSTAHNYHGTSYTGMTESNIVDGPVGKALHFNGSNNQVYRYLNFAVPKLTVETIHYIDDGSSDDMVISNCDYMGTDNDFQTYTSNHQSCKINQVVVPDVIAQSYETWYYNAATYDISSFKYFNNGNLKQTVSYTGTSTQSSTPWIIGADADGDTDIGDGNFLQGRISEVRLSSIARSDSWVNTSYYSNFDTLVTFSSADIYLFTGYVKELNVPVQRKVYLYERESGELVDKITSDSNGYYLLKSPYNTEHNIVCLDISEEPDFNDLIVSKVTPTEIL